MHGGRCPARAGNGRECLVDDGLPPTQSGDRPTGERETPMALTTFAIGMMLFGLFFALVVACDRI